MQGRLASWQEADNEGGTDCGGEAHHMGGTQCEGEANFSEGDRPNNDDDED